MQQSTASQIVPEIERAELEVRAREAKFAAGVVQQKADADAAAAAEQQKAAEAAAPAAATMHQSSSEMDGVEGAGLLAEAPADESQAAQAVGVDTFSGQTHILLSCCRCMLGCHPDGHCHLHVLVEHLHVHEIGEFSVSV